MAGEDNTRPDGPAPHDDDELLAALFERSQAAPDEPDPELLQLRPRINWLRPFLMIAVIAFSALILQKFRPELEYFFSPAEPIALGDATDFPTRAQTEPGWTPDLQHNRFVSLAGIPSRRTISCSPPTRYFKLVGSHLYVEEPLSDVENALECEKSKKDPLGEDIDFFAGQGRLLSMDRVGVRYDGLKDFYEAKFGELFCDRLTPAKEQKRLEDLRQILRGHLTEKFKRPPTDAELEEALKKERVCHNAWVVLADRPPATYWPYVALAAFLALISLWNVAMLIRWSIRTAQALKS